MAEEALQSFESLLAKIPLWIADLEAVARSSAQRQVEALRDHQPKITLPQQHQPEFQLSRGVPSKSSSLRSTRSRDDNERRSSRLGSKQQRKQLLHFTTSDALCQAQRKQYNLLVSSGPTANHIPVIHTRSTAIVFFDGETQQNFETLVRALGSNRNHLRKGKMSATVAALSRLGSSGSDSSSSSAGEEASPKLDGLFPPISHRRRSMGRPNVTAAFDQVDKLLEKAQLVTEHAAHQVLRNGGCAAELNTAREQLEEARRIGEAELPNLQRKAERQRRGDERRRAVEDAEAGGKWNGLEADDDVEDCDDCFADIERKFRTDMKQLSTGTLSLTTATNTQPSTPPQILEADVDIEVDNVPQLDHATPHNGVPIHPLVYNKYRNFDSRDGSWHYSQTWIHD